MKLIDVVKKAPLLGLIAIPLMLLGCSSKQQQAKTKATNKEISEVMIDGAPKKTTYDEFDLKWDLNGVVVRVEYTDNTTDYISIYNSQVTYECYPEKPFNLASEKVSLEVKNVTYTTKDNFKYELGYRIYTMNITKMDKKQKTNSVIANIVAISGTIMATFFLVVFAKKRD